MSKSPLLRRIAFAAAAVCLVSCGLSAQDPGTGTGANVLTWQNDLGRTGQNLKETTVDYLSLSTKSFGQLCSAQLDGQVYSQPLVLQPGKINDAIVWAIKGDGSVQGSSTVGTLYAFKAIEMTQLYSSSLCTGDAMTYPATKFSVPAVANGFAYLGGQGPFNTAQSNWNSGMFYIFGVLTPARSC